jgi:hypothetical protein
MPEHNFDNVLGDRLSAEHSADTMMAEVIVQTNMAHITVLHVVHAFFMSRMNRRRTSRMVEIFEKPRERYVAV